MNTNNPFDTQPSAQDKLNQSRSRLRLAVFAAFAVSLLVIVPLLVQGCKRQEETPPSLEPTNTPVAEELTNLPPTDLTHTNLILPPLAPLGTNVMTPVVAPTVVETAAPTAGVTEHIVAKGDSFFTIGKKFGVSTKAMQDANPGVDSTKLKIGQKLNVPAAVAREAAVGGGVAATGGGENVYTVKSGDTLMKIAKQHGTTYKAIKAANGLTTDKIRVGQKLKIPVKESVPVTAPVVEPAPITIVPPPASLPLLPPPPTTTK
jgi:LysM repeat protein